MAVDEKKKDPAGSCPKGDTVTKIPDKEAERWQFPANITVDELSLYRKKRSNVCNKDNLKIEEGSFKYLKSEYTRRFKNFYESLKSANGTQPAIFSYSPVKAEASLKLEGVHDFDTEYNESFNKHSMERLIKPFHKIIDNEQMEKEISTRIIPAIEEIQHIRHSRYSLLRRPTTLKLEGDFRHVTEHAEKFIQYLLAKRAHLLRTPTHLKLEGDMETKTENREQYVKFDKFERPKLCKQFSELHLEGDLDNMTEKREKFIPYDLSQRPPLVKKLTNLHLEGDLAFTPEYRREFVDHKNIERRKLALPHNNLKPGDLFESDSNEIKLFDSKFYPMIPNLRDSDSKRDSGGPRTPRTPSRREAHRVTHSREAAGLPTRVLSHPNLTITRASNSTLGGETTQLDLGSSYDSLPRRSRSRPTELNYMRGDGKMEVQPEYSSSFVDFPRQRPRLRRPEGQISSEGEMEYITEKSDKFHAHKIMGRSESCKREPELKLEGRLECQPEYRKAYIDYLIREKKPPAQKRRAYDLLEMGDQNQTRSSENIISNGTAEKSKSTSDGEAPKPKPKPPPIYPVDTSTSSVSTSPKQGRQGVRQSQLNMSQIEECAFGPRATSLRRSLSPSPVRGRRGSRGRRVSRDTSPRMKGSWKGADTTKLHDSQMNGKVERNTAFLVLDKPESKRNIRNTLYKEQKWMPSWNYSIQ